jgi:hypothetical protein
MSPIQRQTPTVLSIAREYVDRDHLQGGLWWRNIVAGANFSTMVHRVVNLWPELSGQGITFMAPGDLPGDPVSLGNTESDIPGRAHADGHRFTADSAARGWKMDLSSPISTYAGKIKKCVELEDAGRCQISVLLIPQSNIYSRNFFVDSRAGLA